MSDDVVGALAREILRQGPDFGLAVVYRLLKDVPRPVAFEWLARIKRQDRVGLLQLLQQTMAAERHAAEKQKLLKPGDPWHRKRDGRFVGPGNSDPIPGEIPWAPPPSGYPTPSKRRDPLQWDGDLSARR